VSFLCTCVKVQNKGSSGKAATTTILVVLHLPNPQKAAWQRHFYESDN